MTRIKCKKCGNNTFKNEEIYNNNGLLEAISLICSKCGEVMILPFKKEQEFRQKLRDKQNNNCFTCGKENPRTLHHRDSNPNNNSENNLVLICGKCHKKLNRIRDVIRTAKSEFRDEIMVYIKTL